MLTRCKSLARRGRTLTAHSSWLVGLAAVVVLAGCGGSSSSSPPRAHASPTIARAPAVLTNPSPPPTPKGLRIPTPVPGTPPARLPTLVPLPTATTIPASDFTARIHGTISDAQSGSPISQATVVIGINLRTVKTNAYGQYSSAFPANVSVPVTTSAHGYGGGLAIGKLGSHKSATVNFKLNRVGKGGVAPPSLPSLFGEK